MSAPDGVIVAGVPMNLPPKHTAQLLSGEPDDGPVRRFIRSSPDATVYHQSPYIDFARMTNGAADLVLIVREGEPVFALPVHPQGRYSISTGYSGVLFPPGSREGEVKRWVRSFHEVLAANPLLAVEALQSLQAPAYDDRRRTELLQCYLDEAGMLGPRLWSRALDFPNGA